MIKPLILFTQMEKRLVCSERSRRKRTRPIQPTFGFTLIELLVVIAIIGLIVSLTVPAVTAALDRGKRVYCLSNMRQCNVALLGYISEYQQCPPTMDDINGNRWYEEEWLGPFFGTPPRRNNRATGGPATESVIACAAPAVGIGFPERNWIGYNNRLNLLAMSGYPQTGDGSVADFNNNGHPDKFDPGPSLWIQKDASQFVTFADSSNWGLNWISNYGYNDGSQYRGLELYGGFNPRHQGGCNYAFLDGSARWIRDPDQAYFNQTMYIDPVHPRR